MGFDGSYALGVTYSDPCRQLVRDRLAVIPEIFKAGTLVVLADRLPGAMHSAPPNRAHQDDKRLNVLKRDFVATMSMHGKGKIIAGLAMTT